MSTIRADTFENTAGGAPTLTGLYPARAWCFWDDASAIQQSANVSSLTNNGTGDFTLNFTNNMPVSKYPITGSCGAEADNGGVYPRSVTIDPFTFTTSSVRFLTVYTQATTLTADISMVVVHA